MDIRIFRMVPAGSPDAVVVTTLAEAFPDDAEEAEACRVELEAHGVHWYGGGAEERALLARADIDPDGSTVQGELCAEAIRQLIARAADAGWDKPEHPWHTHYLLAREALNSISVVFGTV